jgi:hypothetical protein
MWKILGFAYVSGWAFPGHDERDYRDLPGVGGMRNGNAEGEMKNAKSAVGRRSVLTLGMVKTTIKEMVP